MTGKKNNGPTQPENGGDAGDAGREDDSLDDSNGASRGDADANSGDARADGQENECDPGIGDGSGGGNSDEDGNNGGGGGSNGGGSDGDGDHNGDSGGGGSGGGSGSNGGGGLGDGNGGGGGGGDGGLLARWRSRCGSWMTHIKAEWRRLRVEAQAPSNGSWTSLPGLFNGYYYYFVWAVMISLLVVIVGTSCYWRFAWREMPPAVAIPRLKGNVTDAAISEHPICRGGVKTRIDGCILDEGTDDLEIKSLFNNTSVANVDDLNRYIYVAIMHVIVLRRHFAEPTNKIEPQKVGKDDVNIYLQQMLPTMEGEGIVTSQDPSAVIDEMNRHLYKTIVHTSLLQRRYLINPIPSPIPGPSPPNPIPGPSPPNPIPDPSLVPGPSPPSPILITPSPIPGPSPPSLIPSPVSPPFLGLICQPEPCDRQQLEEARAEIRRLKEMLMESNKTIGQLKSEVEAYKKGCPCTTNCKVEVPECLAETKVTQEGADDSKEDE